MENLKIPTDEAVASLVNQSPTEPGKVRVPTRKATEPQVKPGLTRTMETVDDGLKSLFRTLTSGESRWPLYLWGEPGRGKTCAALALCDRCVHAPYWTVRELIERELNPERQLPWQVGGQRYYVHHSEPQGIAVLDELGETPATGKHWTERLHSELVKAFADWRISTALGVAIYISNLSPEQFRGHYDGRIASRVLSGTWYELRGVDRRMAGVG